MTTDVLPEPEPDASPPRRTSRVGLVVAVTALLVAGVGSAVYVGGTGGNTPEEAVEELADAISAEDLLGVVDALPPSERDTLRRTVEDVTEELRRLEVLDDRIDLSGIDGIDVELRDLDLSSRTIGDGVAIVSVAGTASYAVDVSELPSGAFVDDKIDGDAMERTSATEPIDNLELVTIREGGRWHVSLFYSVADAIRREAGAPAPDFGNGLQADGETSPERAVRALVDAGTDLDVRRMIELVAPDEGRVLHDYAPLFLDDAERAAAEARRSFDIEVRSFETSVEDRGDAAVVEVTAFEATASGDGEQVDVSFDGECLEITNGGETQSSCDTGENGFGAVPFAAGLSPITGFLGGFRADADSERDALGQQPLTFVTVRRGGEWYISPLRTILDPIVAALRSVDRADLDELGELFGAGFGAGFVAASSGETIATEGGFEVDASEPANDRTTQADLRNALVAFKVAYIDTEAWPTDVSTLSGIEPSLMFIPYTPGFIPPHAVVFEVDGDVARLAARGASGCFYIEARADGAVAYASDPQCGDPADQTYAASW